MKKILSLVIISTLFWTGLLAQEKVKVNLKALDKYYAKMVKDWGIPGVSIGIVKDGELIFKGNYGVKEVGKNEKPDEHTLYAVASNSKAFTSAMIGMLTEEGKLDWNDKSDHVNIRDILSHRVGLGSFSGDNIWYKSNLTAKEIIKHYKYVPQAYDFRTGYGYSNLMYITAGEIIATITGKSWGENVKERILDPLAMNRTIYSIKDLEAKGNYATPHAIKDEKNYAIPWARWDHVAATGGLISSVSDMSKWMIFNLNNGIIGKDTLLTKRVRSMVWTPHNNFYVDQTTKNDFNRRFNAYGLGWGISDYQGRMKVSHTGGYDGMITAVTLIPDEKLGIVVLTNGHKSPILAATYYALDRFLGVKTNKDWSADYLKNTNRRIKNDTRISDRINGRVLNTKPSVVKEKFIGNYHSDIYGKISIIKKDNKLKLDFSHTPQLSATLTHWHYDVWKITWDYPQAWFSFGTIKINMTTNLEVTGFDFDVPNDDFFFEELKPKKIE